MSARWRSFVAVGDSFTEGLSDPYPDGTFRGWADLVANHLAAGTADFRYANLAIRGRLLDSVVDHQVPAALRMSPELVSFAAGGNDVLRRSFDPPHLVDRFDTVVKLLRDGGSDVLVFRFADLTRRLPGGRMIRPRVQFLNRAVGEIAERHGAMLVDLWADDEFHNPGLWSVDRLHLNRYGHRRVAAHVLTVLDQSPDPQWWGPPPAHPAASFLGRRVADARWAGLHLAPWIRRRLTGRSSGDQVLAKRPDLAPLR